VRPDCGGCLQGIHPDEDGACGPVKQIEELKKKGHPLAYVGDVVGTGSSRKSATNSVLWCVAPPRPSLVLPLPHLL